MIRYRLSEIAAGRKGTSVALPVIAGTLSAEHDYLKALRAILRELAKETRKTIVPLAVAEIQANRAMVRDVDRTWFERLLSLSVRLVGVAEAMVTRILRLEAQRHTDRFMQAAKQALGIDLRAVVRQEDLADYLEAVATRNAGLIRGLSDETVNRIQAIVTNAVINGRPANDLKAELTKQFKFSDRRARLIARDQIAKFNSDLNRIRHQQAGVTEYRWRTSHDERVRPLHQKLDGTVYKYGEPTGAEQGLPPGQPINCRCIAQGIVTF